MKHTDKSSASVQPSRRYRKSALTPAKKKFAHVYAQTDNATEAVRQAFPDMVGRTSNEVLRNKAHTLLTNPNISNEVEYQKNKLELLAGRAVNRVEKLIDSENEMVATANVWKTIEQVHGKATQRTESTSTSVNLNLNLADISLDQ